jgi:hypothetical protein
MCVVAVAVALATAAGPAVADPGGPPLQIVLQSGKTTDVGGLADSRSPAFLIEANFYGHSGITVHCRADDGADGPCAADQTPGCPADACWTYVPSVPSDGPHKVTATYDDPSGVPASQDFLFWVDTTPPDTVLHLPPSPDGRLPGNGAFERPAFDIATIDDEQNLIDFPDTAQCAISAPSAATVSWQACPAGPFGPLGLTGVYRLQVRAVDFLGRVDPTPSEYTFSPTPCQARLIGRRPTLAHVIRHGLRARVTCVQPGAFELDLAMPIPEVERLRLPSQILGRVRGHATQGETVTLTVRALRGIPKALVRYPRLRADLSVFELAFGARGGQHNVLLR